MQFRSLGLSFLVIALIIAGAVSGSEPDTTPAEAPATSVESPTADIAGDASGLDALDREELGPLGREIADLLQVEKEELVRLDQEFHAATDPQSALAIQKRIREIKQGTEMSILGAQAKHARLEGNLELARRIEASLQWMKDPSEEPPPSGERHEQPER